MEHQNILTGLYQDFNNRNIDAVLAHLHADVTWPNGWEGGSIHGKDEVRAYWLRQWQEIDPRVVPIAFHRAPDGEITVTVHQVIKALNGQILSDDQISHAYTFEDGKVRAMVIEK